MTTRRSRSEEFRDRISPFLEEWAERGLQPWQQFRNWSVQQILWDADLSMEEVEEVTRVDGQRDEGIDGWYVDELSTPNRLILIQSKDTQIAREDFSKMKDGLKNLLIPGFPLNANRALLEKASLFTRSLPEDFEVDLYLTSSSIAQQHLQPDPTGDPWQTDTMELSHIGRTLKVYQYVRDIRFLVENIQIIHERPIPATFTVERGSCFQFRVGGHTMTVTAALKAEELAALYMQEKQNLFRRNPRYYLGVSGLKNAAIKDTLEAPQNEDFFIFNNGLTCVGREVRVDPSPDNPEGFRIRIQDFQIVNGCQTTATLADPTLGPKLAKVRVLAKIVENPHAGSEETDATSDRIATYSNSQNPLKAEDWKANDPRQKVWHNEFLRGVPDRWFYEIKRGTWSTAFGDATRRRPFRDDNTGKFRKMTMKDLGQECWAFLGFPAEAKDKARQIFNNLTTYDLVFSPTLTAAQLLLPHIVYMAADAKTKTIPTYVLPSTDPQQQQYPEARLQTEHLRHPIVAAIGRILAGLRNTQPGYLSHAESQRLVANKSEWLDILVDEAFSELARTLLLAAARQGIGARSVVRSNDWLVDALHTLTRLVISRVQTEQSAGAGPRTLANALRVNDPQSPTN